MNPVLIVILTQLLFTTSDILARYNMKSGGFNLNNFISIWFVSYFLIRIIAMFGQLYVFSNVELGKTAALFGVSSIVIANIVGFLLLGEILSVKAYIGVSVAIIAFLIMATSG